MTEVMPVVLCPRCREAFNSQEELDMHICQLARRKELTLREAVIIALASERGDGSLTIREIANRAAEVRHNTGTGAVATCLENLRAEGFVELTGTGPRKYRFKWERKGE